MRVRSLLLAFGVCVIATTVGLFARPLPAFAWDVPSPVTNPFSSTVSTGTRTAGLCAESAATGCLVVAGVGAYQGTCWLLGKVYSDPDGCSQGLKTIVSWISPFGGDNRTEYTGPAGVINASSYAGAASRTTVKFFAATNANYDQFYAYVTYRNASTGQDCPSRAFGKGWTNQTYTVDLPAWVGQSGQTATYQMQQAGMFSTSGGTGCSSSTQTSYLWQIELHGTTGSNDAGLLAKWTADPGYGTPWKMDFNQTCVTSSGQEATFSQSINFTPVSGLESPKAELPACWDLLPGSHLKSLTALGDRAGITAPTPNVKVTVGGTPADKEQAYPLCTTSAPSEGCWLDLQRDGKSCFGPNVYCAGWLQNETRWNMTCEWGPYSLALSVCEAEYATKFDGQTQPKADTSAGTSTGGIPSTGTNPGAPSIDPDASTDPDTSNCYSAAWSWNPVDWVYVPVKCALLWAFVPKSPPSFSDIPSPLPAGWLPSFPGLTDGACGPITMPALQFPMLGTVEARQFVNTCSAPWPMVRSFTYYGLLAGLLVTVGNRSLRVVMAGLGMGVDAPAAGGGED